MGLRGVIASLQTGTYTVTRRAAGAYVDGRYQPGATSTVEIVASVQPVTGRTLQDLPEGQRGEETRVVYTETEIRSHGPGIEPDRITLDGETWICIRSERWQGLGGTHWRAYFQRDISRP